MQKKQIPAVEGWYSVKPDGVHFIGSRCKVCGDYFFPKVSRCRNSNCRATDTEEVLLSNRGKLWSYVIQTYPPPPPYKAATPFTPFGIGEVRLPEGIKVLGQISSRCDLSRLQIGMEVELIEEELCEDDEGNELMVWKFKPTEI